MIDITKINTNKQTGNLSTSIETYVSMSKSSYTNVSGSAPSRYILMVIEQKWGDNAVISASNAVSNS